MSKSERAIADRVLERVEQCLTTPLRATAPVLQVRPKGGVEFIASAVLLDAGAHAFALTASHVLDKEPGGELLLGRKGDAVSLRGPRALTRIPAGGTRDDDHIDLAMVHLTDKVRSSFDRDEFIQVGQLYLGPSQAGDFIVAGYPITHQPRVLAPGNDTAHLYGLLAEELAPDTYRHSGFDRGTSLLLGFDQKRTWRKGVGAATAPRLYGVSGGGVWKPHR